MRGFTLLEVVVALMIAAFAAAALVQAVGTGLRATGDAAAYEQAIVRAKSHLAAVTAPRPGDTQGDDGGGFHWHLRVVPVQSANVRPVGLIGPRAQRSVQVVLYRVVSSISWSGGSVSLQSERVGGA